YSRDGGLLEKTYPPVYLYYPKNAGRRKRVKALIDFLIMHAADDAEKVGSSPLAFSSDRAALFPGGGGS
ncbi:hypothetical protein AMC96_00330, partial [Klebsiella pneumoniae]